ALRCSYSSVAAIRRPGTRFAGFGYEQRAGTQRRTRLAHQVAQAADRHGRAGFLIPIVIILLLVSMVASGTKTGAGSDSLTEEAVARRIAPVAGFELVDANAPKVFKTGEQVFQAVCTACHTAGVAGAPKLGDKA